MGTTLNGGADDSATVVDQTTASASKDTMEKDNGIDSVEVTTPAVVVDDHDSATTITVKEASDSDSAMSSLSSSSLSSSSSSSQHSLVGVGKVTMVAAVTTVTTAGITLFL